MDQNRVEGVTRAVGGKLEAAVGSLTGDAKLQSDGFVDKAVGKAQNVYGSAKDTMRDAANEYGGGLLDTVEEYGDLLAEKVDERPLMAVLIAAGVGFLLALATRPGPNVVYRRR
jgi:uncharacterized protein YjbJ (UPF0337 family)